MEILDTNMCTFCKKEVETLKHLFWQCSFVQTFWKSVKKWCILKLKVYVQSVSNLFIQSTVFFGEMSPGKMF